MGSYIPTKSIRAYMLNPRSAFCKPNDASNRKNGREEWIDKL